MRHVLKFLHTVGAAGMTGTVATVGVVMTLAPTAVGTAGYLPVLLAMAKVTAWIIGPAIFVTVASGLLAMLLTPAFQDRGWVWAKAATGIAMLEGGLMALGPIQEEARRSAEKVSASPDPASIARLFHAEASTLWVLLAVSVANIALGVWRPRFPRYPV